MCLHSEADRCLHGNKAKLKMNETPNYPSVGLLAVYGHLFQVIKVELAGSKAQSRLLDY